MRLDDRDWNARLRRRLDQGAERLQQLEERISTGRMLSRPSDGPAAFARAGALEARVDGLERQVTRFSQASLQVDGVEAVITDLAAVVQRAHSIAMQASNAPTDAAARQALAGEVDSLVHSALARANTEIGGRFVLSGSKSGTRPFQSSGAGEIQSVAYAGDRRSPSFGLPVGERLNTNLNGDAVVAGSGEDMFASLLALRDALRAPTFDGQALQVRLEKVSQNLLERRVEAASASRYLQGLSTTAQETALQARASLEAEAGADIVEATVELKQVDLYQQATLQIVARTGKLRLVDYLR